MELKNIVSEYVHRHELLDKNKRYIVAISGGADSVALLLFLLELGFDVEAAHCNFHLRGVESDRDEAFVRDLCAKKNVPFHIAHFDTTEYASLHKISIEMAARQLRYSYFEQLRNDIGAEAICVAHHRNDNVETMLMNLVRGTGIHGLIGIHPKNGRIIRPLLCVCRKDIEEYLISLEQAYVTDSTNLVADVTRNIIRLKILPLLAEINPRVVENMQRTAEYVNEAVKVFDASIRKAVKEVMTIDSGFPVIDICKLRQQTSPECVLYEIVKAFGFKSQQAEQIYLNINAATGRMFSSADYELAFDRGRMIISPIEKPHSIMVVPETGVYVYANGSRIRISRSIIDEQFQVSRLRNVICVDASKVVFPLTIRPVRTGDRFVPFGMRGTKLVSDYLTDHKKNVFQKRAQLVLEDASGAIVWLINERSDNRFRVTDSTRDVLVVSHEQTSEKDKSIL